MFEKPCHQHWQNMQGQVVNYWQRKGELPNSLTDLNDSIAGYVVPQDPETKQGYGYAVKNVAGLSFELCATFNLPSPAVMNRNGKPMPVPAPYYDGISQNFDHCPRPPF